MEKEILTISDVINDGVFDNLVGANAFKYSTIFSFWTQIVGQKFKTTSRPISIKNAKMHICCKNPYVVQELLMHKNIILEKLKPYSEPLGVKITDIIFDYKNWQNAQNATDFEDFSHFYTENELKQAEFCTEEFEKTFSNIDSSKFLSATQKQKFKERIIKLNKAQKLRNK